MMPMQMARSRPYRHLTVKPVFATAFLLFSFHTAQAGETSVPWECSQYEGAAQTRCLNAFIELQRDTMSRMDAQLKGQEKALADLKGTVDRQSAAAADFQRQLSDRPPTIVAPPLYPYSYAYVYPPSIGFGFAWGQPWAYGYPHFFRPFGPPLHYRHWRHR